MLRDHSRGLRLLTIIVAICTGYAVVRYHLAQPEPWSRFFFWTANKSISFAAAALLAASYLSVPRDRSLARNLGLAGFALALIHSLLSWPLLGSANYPKLYLDGALNSAGLWCLAFGGAAMAALLAPALASLNGARERLGPARWSSMQRLGYSALALTAVHVFVIGYKGWLAPRAWPAALPPITLLSFLIAAAPVLRWLALRKGNSNA